MGSNRAPATVVICCGMPVDASRGDVATWTDLATRTHVPITWACRRDTLPTVLAALGGVNDHEFALELNPMHLAFRPALRREIAAARDVAGSLASVVIAGTPCLDHRALFVEQGIQTLAVGGFEHTGRTSRRPPPAGWQCRSIVWGLWEVQTVPSPPRHPMAWMLGGFAAPRLAEGSLTVVHIAPDMIGERQARIALERLVQWIGGRPAGVQPARLSDLPGLLRAGGQPESGSVLRQAA